MDFLYALPGAAAEGLIWGLVAIGIYISFKILDIADMTVDGSICTGAFAYGFVAMMDMPGWMPQWLHILLAILLAVVTGAMTGAVTGLLHTLFGVPAILAGILTQLMLYSVNLLFFGKSLATLVGTNAPTLLNSDNYQAIGVSVVVIAVTIVLLWLFFYTEVGLTIKSTGDNPHMSRAQGVNVERNKVIGLAISNAIVALAGALLIQYKGSMDLAGGRGTIVIGLAAIFIGLSVSMKIKPNFVVSLIGVVFGSVVYFAIFNLAIMLMSRVGISTDYLKMLSAVIVGLFIGVPYLKKTYFQKKKPLPLEQTGGTGNA